MEVSKIRAKIKVKPIYTCCNCGKRATGTTEKIKILTDSLDEIEHIIGDMDLRSDSMPVGWAYFSTQGFMCCGFTSARP